MNEIRRPANNTGTLLGLGALCAGAWFVGRKYLRANPHYDLRDKNVLITGGSRGFGLALAQQFGSRGARLALCARDRAELDRALADLKGRAIEAHAIQADLTRPGEIESVLEQAWQTLGSVDVLVNNAGEITVGSFDSFTHQDFESAMDLMFWAPVNLTLALLRRMRTRGSGRIVNITSVGGRVSIPHLLPYSCAKFALVGFSTGLGAEVKKNGVIVHTVVPGLLRTGSYLQAEFKGAPKEEFAWFGLLGNMPGLSTPAARAAAEVIRAVERGEENCTISLPAKALIALEALLPDVNRSLLAFADQYVLPEAHSDASTQGKTLSPKLNALYQGVTALGKLAAIRWNEF